MGMESIQGGGGDEDAGRGEDGGNQREHENALDESSDHEACRTIQRNKKSERSRASFKSHCCASPCSTMANFVFPFNCFFNLFLNELPNRFVARAYYAHRLTSAGYCCTMQSREA